MGSVDHPLLEGLCPHPFLRELDYSRDGGFLPGRLCVAYEFINATCCVPCPLTDWVYSEGFTKRTEVGNWVNLAALFATAFLLLSFACLDVKWTHRHYLSVCLAIGVFFIELAFIVPLAAAPDQCYNDITPHGMRSDVTCALSGSFLLFGGWAAVVWVFWRALSIHLQICWAVVPGPKFFYSALALGWGIPAMSLAVVLSLTGVSYRFGNVCHINHELGLQDFWGPLLAVAALAMMLQFFTMGYCIHVFIKSLLKESAASGNGNGNSNSGALPSYSGSFAANSARQTYRRVKRVVQLQWRGASTVLLIVAEVVFFSIVFVSMDNSTQLNQDLLNRALPWALCVLSKNGDKEACLQHTTDFVVSESTILAVLVCLGMSGFWCLLLLGRWSMVLGWKDLIVRRLSKRGGSGGADRRPCPLPTDQRTYEMLDSKKTAPPALSLATPQPAASSPTSFTDISPISPDRKFPDDYFSRQHAAKIIGISISTESSPATPHAPKHQWTSMRPETPLTHDSLPKMAISKDYA